MLDRSNGLQYVTMFNLVQNPLHIFVGREDNFVEESTRRKREERGTQIM